MIVVGLGKAGCNIAKAFSKFPQYETYGIDTSRDADITIKKKKLWKKAKKGLNLTHAINT